MKTLRSQDGGAESQPLVCPSPQQDAQAGPAKTPEEGLDQSARLSWKASLPVMPAAVPPTGASAGGAEGSQKQEGGTAGGTKPSPVAMLTEEAAMAISVEHLSLLSADPRTRKTPEPSPSRVNETAACATSPAVEVYPKGSRGLVLAGDASPESAWQWQASQCEAQNPHPRILPQEELQLPRVDCCDQVFASARVAGGETENLRLPEPELLRWKQLSPRARLMAPLDAHSGAAAPSLRPEAELDGELPSHSLFLALHHRRLVAEQLDNIVEWQKRVAEDRAHVSTDCSPLLQAVALLPAEIKESMLLLGIRVQELVCRIQRINAAYLRAVHEGEVMSEVDRLWEEGSEALQTLKQDISCMRCQLERGAAAAAAAAGGSGGGSCSHSTEFSPGWAVEGRLHRQEEEEKEGSHNVEETHGVSKSTKCRASNSEGKEKADANLDGMSDSGFR